MILHIESTQRGHQALLEYKSVPCPPCSRVDVFETSRLRMEAMSILKLSHEGGECSGFEWLEGPSDITTMITYNETGGYAEEVITDGEPEVLHSVPVMKWNEQNRSHYVTGYQKLVRFKKVRYVITKHLVRVDRTLRLEDVLIKWLGIAPKAAAETGSLPQGDATGVGAE